MGSSSKRFMGFGEKDVEDLSMIKEKAIRLHIMFLYIIAAFCFVYGIVDIYLNQYDQAWVMLITIGSTGFSYFLYYLNLSKNLNQS